VYVLKSIFEQAPRPNTFRRFWPFVSSRDKYNAYPAHMPVASALRDMASLTGHDKYVWTQNIVIDLYADILRRCGLCLNRQRRIVVNFFQLCKRRP
jgi:hypothetical protein